MSTKLNTPGLTELNAFLEQLAQADVDLGNKLNAIQEQVKQLQAKDKALDATDAALQAEIAVEQKENDDQQKEIDQNKADIASEKAQREAADKRLKNALDDEKTAREAADARIVKDIEELQGEVKELQFEIKRLGGFGQIYGGNGGYPFAGSGKQVTGIIIVTDDKYLNSIQFAIDGGNYSSKYGLGEGTAQELVCAEGEYFNKVILRYEPDNYGYPASNAITVIGAIEFITNKGKRIVGGKQAGSIHIEAKGILAGVCGRSGNVVDQLQFYWKAN